MTCPNCYEFFYYESLEFCVKSPDNNFYFYLPHGTSIANASNYHIYADNETDYRIKIDIPIADITCENCSS